MVKDFCNIFLQSFGLSLLSVPKCSGFVPVYSALLKVHCVKCCNIQIIKAPDTLTEADKGSTDGGNAGSGQLCKCGEDSSLSSPLFWRSSRSCVISLCSCLFFSFSAEIRASKLSHLCFNRPMFFRASTVSGYIWEPHTLWDSGTFSVRSVVSVVESGVDCVLPTEVCASERSCSDCVECISFVSLV